MAQVRDEGRPARAKKAPVRNRVVVTNTARKAAGAAVDAYVTEVTLSQDRFARIAGRPGPLQKILAGYADSVSEARRAGRGVTLRIHVSPSGDADQIDLGSSGDVLETALAAARERGRATVSEILKNTEMLSAREFGMLIGASHETVNVRRRRHEILGLEGAVRGIRYPRWQLTDDGLPLPGLPRLFALLGDPWTVHRFLLANHPDLAGRTGLEALKAGEIDTALAIATNQVTGVFA